MTTPARILATGIMASANRREESYDKAAADAATLNAGLTGFVDYTKFYRLSLDEACAPEGDLAQPIHFLLYNSWNDACDWAENYLGNPNGN